MDGVNIDFTWKLAYEGKPMFTTSEAKPKPAQKSLSCFSCLSMLIKKKHLSMLTNKINHNATYISKRIIQDKRSTI